MLSLSPLSLAARSVADGSTSNDELPIAAPTGVYGCVLLTPLTGEVAGAREPSEIGTSAGSQPKVRNLGTSGTRDLPLSLLSISARLVLARILLLTLGLTDGPEVSVLARAWTCPTIKSSPKGRRSPWLFASTIASWARGNNHQEHAPSGIVMCSYLSSESSNG